MNWLDLTLKEIWGLEERTLGQTFVLDTILHSSGHDENIILVLPCSNVSRRALRNKKPFPTYGSSASEIVQNLNKYITYPNILCIASGMVIFVLDGSRPM